MKQTMRFLRPGMTQDTANMGDAQTLYEFLAYANENYPADKVAVTFWNHGGGSVNGAAFDELHNLDSLDLAEMYEAFDAVWPSDTEHPALELVGFDTCLMATVDESGMAGKELRLLEEGDKITTIWKLASYSGDDDFEMYTVDDLTVTADTSFGEIDLYDGKYILMYEMWDAAGNYVYSDSADIDYLDGEMTTTI